MKKLFWLMLFVSVQANAFEIISVDSVNLTVSYTEPTLNADGSALTDLAITRIYVDLIGDGIDPVVAKEIPATSPNGGSAMSEKIPVSVGEGQEADIRVWATAVDNSGNESTASNVAQIRVDRLAPAAPN